MFIVEAGAALTTVLAIALPFLGSDATTIGFTWAIAVWLWLTVLFATLAEAVAEGRGRAQAASLRATRTTTAATRVTGTTRRAIPRDGAATESVASADLRQGDVVLVVEGEVIPGDGDIVAGIASVDESAITGESAPVVREAGGDRSAVTGGTRVLSDRIVVQITSKPGETFVDRMIALVEGAVRQKTPNELALSVLLASLTIVFLIVVLVLGPIAGFQKAAPERRRAHRAAGLPHPHDHRRAPLRDRHRRHGPAGAAERARDLRSRRRGGGRRDDAAARQDRHDHLRQPPRGRLPPAPRRRRDPADGGRGAVLDRRPDAGGRELVELAAERGFVPTEATGRTVVPFTAQTRMSGIDEADGRALRKGASASVLAWVHEHGAVAPAVAAALDERVRGISEQGGTPLAVAELDADGTARLLGVIHLKDVVKAGLAERFAALRAWASARSW